MTQRGNRQPMHWLTKSFYLVIIAGFLVLGLVGLVLPIIPGLVFLFLALLLLTRVSTRVNTLAGSHAGFRHWRRRWRTLNLLKAADRVQLACWYCAGALITGVESISRYVAARLRSRPSSQ